MKTKLFPTFVIAAGLLALGAQAQVADTTAAPQPTQVVYSPRLPSAAELSNVAAAQGLTIDKIIQTATQMTLVYRTANGQTNTVAYMLLPAAGNAPASAPATVSTTTVAAPTTPAPQVVYTPAPAAPQVVYYSAPAPVYYSPYYYPTYYASPWYTPVSVSLGFGFGYYGGNYYRGGGHYHGGGHGHGRH
jgi:hypothetical protein